MKNEKTFKERLLQFFRIKQNQEQMQQQEIPQDTKTGNKEPSDFRKMLVQLSSPYKKTEASEIFGERDRKDKMGSGKPSVFWDTEVSYVQKYENAPLKKNQGKEPEGH